MIKKTRANQSKQAVINIEFFEQSCQQYTHLEDWNALSHLILKEAENLAANGELSTLKAWLNQLPESYFINDTWLTYWQAMCLRFNQHPLALQQLESVFNTFTVEKNIKGQYLTWLAIVESIALAFDDLSPLKHWIKHYELLKSRHPRCPGIELKLKVFALAAGVMSMTQPGHPRLKKLIRICQIGGPLIPFKEPRAAILAYLAFHYFSSGQIARLNALSKHLEPALHDHSLPVPLRLLTYAMLGQHEIIIGTETAHEILEDGMAIATPEDVFFSTVHAYRIYSDAMNFKLTEANTQLQLFLTQIPSGQRMDLSHHDFMLAWVIALEGKYSVALEQSQLAKVLAKTLGFDFGVALNCNLSAQLAVLQNNFATAQTELNELSQLADNNNSQLLKIMHCFSAAWLQLKEFNDQSALVKIKQAFDMAEKEGVLAFPGFLHPVMAELALSTIKYQNTSSFIKQMIRRWKLKPLSSIKYQIDWPWKIRIQSLGGFGLEIDDQLIDQSSRAHRRSIELLQVLIALGGQQVDKGIVSQILWPDSDGDKASHALENLIHRARKLLGPTILIINSGGIQLNPAQCWIDTWALNTMAIEDIKCRDDAVITKQKLLNIYRGPLLPSNDSNWVFAIRENLRRVFINKVIKLEQHLSRWQLQEEAIDLLLQAIEREPRHEEFYFQLAQYYSAAGSYSEAKHTYQRCQQVLLITYHTPPSKAFQEFAERITL